MDNKVWVGIDAGKELHWAHVLDASGQSSSPAGSKTKRPTSLRLIDEVSRLAGGARLGRRSAGRHRGAALALLWERDQRFSTSRPGCGPGSRRLPWRVQDRRP